MIETVKAYNRGNFLYSLENKEFKGQIFSNNKFLSLCKELNIDFLSLEEFCNKRKYARFYKAIVVEPLQGGDTYRLWKNRFVTFYDDDVELNEWSNNRMYFEDSQSFRDNFGTAIWYSISLAKQLSLIGKPFVVCLNYQDSRDNQSLLYDLGITDSVKVTFCRKGSLFEHPERVCQQSSDALLVINIPIF